MSKSKRKQSSKVVNAPDVTFATLIHDEPMTVVGAQDTVLLQSNVSGKPYFLPSDIRLGKGAIGQQCTVYVREITNEVISRPGKNDVYEEELSRPENSNVMPIDSWDDVLTLMDELKLKKVTGAMIQLVNALGGLLLIAVSCWLLTTDFFLKPALYATLAVGVIVLCWAIWKMMRGVVCLNSKVIMDGQGRYINLDTGKSNLNGGMKIPIKQQ